jgi:peptidoglycan/LPS O-acetylase OafA/YrhL
MPRPAETGRRYVPGLDGLRAVAVLAVIGYHLNLSWVKGGLLGVGVFFTLSGYLITDLLLGHWHDRGSLGLGNFWLRRARRLLPALFLMLIVMAVCVALFDAAELVAFRKQVFAAALYLSNWWTIAEHGSYFSRFAAPLPLDHLWSLAIEEQFYLVWPWLLWLGLRAVPRLSRLALVTLVGAAASALAVALIYRAGQDPTRVYEGTDTRAFELLLGAALAMVWPSSQLRGDIAPGARNLLDVAGLAGLAGILVLACGTDSYSSFLYPAGFVLLSVATAVVVAVVVHPASRLGRVLGWRPLRWVGVRSYGIYLWHWPIIVLTNPAKGGVNLLRGALQVTATFVIAALSWRYVEEPIRRGGLKQFRSQARSVVSRLAPRRALAATGAGLMAVCLAAVCLAGLLPAASAGPASAGRTSGALPHPLAGRRAAVAHRIALVAGPPATRTSCRSVAYIGDSTSEGEISTDYIPNWTLRLIHQLAEVGVSSVHTEISGARSIVETFEEQPNAATVARNLVSRGFRGCWIFALGTNEAANIYDGSNVGQAGRIARMMSISGGDPVLWVDAVSLVRSGDYAGDLMQRWNQDLVASCTRYPTMRVFDWAAIAQRQWFIPDGIHYTSPGYVQRTHDIAQALVEAFPANLPPSASCLVR